MLQEQQLDMFPNLHVLTHVHLQKILELEEQYHKLRKGIFKRYNDQEEAIKSLSAVLLKIIQDENED